MRFYPGSGNPLSWPMGVLRACAAMMPKLQASESLNAVTIARIGNGSMKQELINQIISGWAELSEGRKAEAPKPRFNLAALAAAGVGIHEVKS